MLALAFGALVRLSELLRGGLRSGKQLQRQRRVESALERDRGICQVCGTPGADDVDYVVPPSDGGVERVFNLVSVHSTSCKRGANGG